MYNLVTYGVPKTRVYSSLVKSMRNLIRNDWFVEISGVKRANPARLDLAHLGLHVK